MAAYNHAGYVSQAILSVLAQSWENLELIVVDDGSTDHTREVVAGFDDPRVRYIYQENSGPAAARNRGIHAARSEWVALLDSDDVWTLDHLARMTAAINATAGAANFYFADAILPPEKGSGSLWESLAFKIGGDYQLVADGANWVMMDTQPMMLQSTVFKRSALLECGGFLSALHYSEDTHMFIRLGVVGPICAVAGIGVHMSGDDDPANRLTLSYERTARIFYMKVIMHQDLLMRLPEDLAPGVRRTLRKRLAIAHWSLARAAWLERNWAEFARRAGQSARLEPRLFMTRLLAILIRQVINR